MATPQSTENASGKTYDLKLSFRLLRYLRPYKGYALFSLFCLLLTAPLGLAGPPLTKAAIDLFLAPVPEQRLTDFEQFLKHAIEGVGLGHNAATGILFIVMLFLLAHLTFFVLQAAQGMLLQWTGQRIMFDLRRDIFKKLQQLHLQFYDRNPIGHLMTRMTTDVDTLNEMFTSGLIVVIGDIVVACYIVFYMFSVNWRLALASFTILPLLIWLTIWFKRGARHAFRDIRERVAAINALLQERLTGMSVVQLFNQEEKEWRRFERVNHEHLQSNLSTVFYFSIFYPTVELLGTLGVALILWFGGGEVLMKAATLGTLVAFIQLTRSFYEPISDISDRYNILQSAMASGERIFALLDEPVEITSPAQAKRLGAARGRIEFRDVWFAYQDEDWVLKGISFVIEPGEKVAFVGHTGAGKTTITNLLLRFYDIQRGRILLDGVDVREFGLDDLRANFSIVLQDVFLFSGDVASNIRLGNEDISDERLRAVAREVNADNFIRKLPAGYETELNERGAGLSVGQKQLISFARALARDPRVLIMDEATSSIDTETDFLIRDALARLLEGRTSLVIAHRLSTIQSVDKIIVLHKGELREMGAHQELLTQRGLYWRLYQLQFPQDHRDVELLSASSI